jgi:osmotically-inducible protein OsmY
MPDAKFPTEDDDLEPAGLALSARTRAMEPNSHDVVLQSRIWEQIRATRELDTTDVSVVVRNRGATLFGTVADEGQRAQLERIATGISGVVEVTNRLKVKAPTH